MDERDREGTAATLRAVGWIVLVGIGLGLAFNVQGLASRPPRGLPWIRRPERMPSLEELQPASSLVPRGLSAFSLVGTAWAGGVAPPTDTLRAPAKKPAAGAVTGAKAAPATAKKPAGSATRAPVQVVKNRTQPVKPAIQRVETTPAPSAAAKPDLPVVPDLDQPIEVKLANVKKFYDAGAAVILDAREAPEYAEGHIAGAQSLPYEAVTAKPERIEPYRKAGKPLILYCSPGCESSHELAKFMVSEGIRKVLVFTEGFPAWQAAGYPVEKGEAGVKR